MKLIYPIDIKEAIKKIEKASGDKVRRRTHYIYASPTVSFTDERYPLEIVETPVDKLPKDTEILIAPKPEVAERRKRRETIPRIK